MANLEAHTDWYHGNNLNSTSTLVTALYTILELNFMGLDQFMKTAKLCSSKISGFLSLSFPNLKILFLLYVMYLQVCMWNVVLTTCSIPQLFLCLVPGQPSITTVNPSTSSISLSWSVPDGSVVTSYEVMWTSGECGGVLSNSTTITGSYTSHTISSLRGDTTYTIRVTVTNPAGSNTSNPMTGETRERGE